MMNRDYEYNGFFIAAELDLEGKPTGFFLVISGEGKVLQVTKSFVAAKVWIDKYVEEHKPQQSELKREQPSVPPRSRGPRG